MPIGPLDDVAVDDRERMIDVNLKGVLYGIAAALPVFRAQGSGHPINIASTAARKTVPNQTIYSATKAAILALSNGLRQELTGRSRVSVIFPGFINTRFLEQVRDGALQAEMRRAAEKYAMDARAVATAVSYAIERPEDVNVGEIIARSTMQP